MLTGVYQRDAGEVLLNGQAIAPRNTAQAQQAGIGTVYQEVNLLPNMSVADNLFIGREPKRFGMVDRKAMAHQARALLNRYGFSLDVNRPLGHYSVAMQQIIAICRAVDLSAQVLILDEPTASLDASEVEMLFTLMNQLKAKGMSLISLPISSTSVPRLRSHHYPSQRPVYRHPRCRHAAAAGADQADAGARTDGDRVAARRQNAEKR